MGTGGKRSRQIKMRPPVTRRSFGRRWSYTHPYEVHRLGPLWVMRDAPRKRAADYRRVDNAELAQRLNKSARRTHVRPEDLSDGAKIRSYVALDDSRVIGWASGITVGDYAWVQSMFVAPQYRRRGIGKAVLSQLLRDGSARSAKATFLTASHAGAMLYPNVGFETIGQLLLFTPRK
jgi:GNAT superfamily N-acetyltransferase